MGYQVFKPNPGETDFIMRGDYATLVLATNAANALPRDEEIRVEARVGAGVPMIALTDVKAAGSRTVLVLAKQ